MEKVLDCECDFKIYQKLYDTEIFHINLPFSKTTRNISCLRREKIDDDDDEIKSHMSGIKIHQKLILIHSLSAFCLHAEWI